MPVRCKRQRRPPSAAAALTLPALPSGLDQNGLAVLQSAISNQVALACVNIMAMDYGDNAAPNPAGRMGDYAIMAATNLFNQLQSAYQAAGRPKTGAQLWPMVGVTPMLGVNDQPDEIFNQAAAAQLAGCAAEKSFGLLAFWSLNRDQPGASGVTQAPYEFTGIFRPFGGGAAPGPGLSCASAGVIVPAAGATNIVFPISLSAASTGTVSVAFFTSDGTAVAPDDYLATNGLLVFAAGQTLQTVSVTVPGRTNAGSNKTFYFNLTNAAGAALFASQAAGIITNASSGSSGGGTNTTGGECAMTSQWLVTYDNGAAFQAVQTLFNPGLTNIILNTFAFDAPYAKIDWIDAGSSSGWVQPGHSGSHFTIGSGWPAPAVVPAGGSLQMTYQGAPGGGPPAPANLVINGVVVGNCGAAAPACFISAVRSGDSILLAWKTIGGETNWVQATSGIAGWTNVSGPIVVAGSGSVATNWMDVNGLTHHASRCYRVLLNQ